MTISVSSGVSTTSRTTTTYHLGSIEQIPPGEGRVYMVAGRQIAIFRTRDDTLYATQAHCPHRNGPLADGLVGLHTVLCPLHSYQFDLRTGAASMPSCTVLTLYPVTVDSSRNIVLQLE